MWCVGYVVFVFVGVLVLVLLVLLLVLPVVWHFLDAVLVRDFALFVHVVVACLVYS